MSRQASIAGLIAGLITITLLPGTAWANPSTASGSCETGVSYEGHDYPQTNGNTVTIFIDNTVVRTVTFSGSTSGTVANPDKTKAHSWRAVWDRVNGTDGDRTQQGEFGACQTPPTTTTVQATTTTSTLPPTTTTTVAPTTTAASTTTAPTTVVDPTTTITFCGDVAGATCVTPPQLPRPVAPPQVTGCTADCPAPPLPKTGSKTDIELAIAFVSLTLGYCLLYIRRSRA